MRLTAWQLLAHQMFTCNNYILNPSAENKYWSNLSGGALDKYIKQCGNAFNIVIAGKPSDEHDYYAIPYSRIQHMLTPEYMAPPTIRHRRRWIVTINHHELSLGRCPFNPDLRAYYGNAFLLHNPTVDEDPDEDNDYAIENMRREVEQRQKQSQFRRNVLNNFQRCCCLTGISEEGLLIASHIIPWKDRVDCRLDPANGLCLSVLYDRLFDRGYITFDDSLKVIVTTRLAEISEPLRSVMTDVADKVAMKPVVNQINPEFLAYHREHVFQSFDVGGT